jgi:uncharacterized cupredoxin-like copper-binding protein
MLRGLSRVLLASIAAANLSSASVAADSQPTVKVVLLDMTSLMSSGFPDQRGGRMGPGMMGQGMMMPGMGGMMGPGMMGSGMPMHGMMSIRATPSSVPAGKIAFEVTNLSRSVAHEMMIVKVDTPDAPLPYDYGTWQVIENQVTSLGDTEKLQPNESKSIEAALNPGYYLLLCNVPGHYAAGMVTSLYVK